MQLVLDPAAVNRLGNPAKQLEVQAGIAESRKRTRGSGLASTSGLSLATPLAFQ